MSQPRKKVTAEEFWAGMDELKEQMRDTDRQIKETGLQMKETDRRLDKRKLEMDRQFEKQKRETDRRIKYLDELFTGQWGKLVESLVEGDLVNLLKDRGIEIERIAQHNPNPKLDGEPYDIDLIAINGKEIVAVEVKTTLNVKKVDKFLNKLKSFKRVFPYHADKQIYAAVAYLKADANSDTYAEKKGLFVIRATGSSASITNEKTFKPKIFG